MNKVIGIAALAIVFATSAASAGSTAKYSVTFNANWSSQTHPLDYPGNAHLSGLIGATHNRGGPTFSTSSQPC